ncbi:MAG: hypothetical protein GXN95_05690 [Methanococci archaeon]|nr:hypothetical protein [Methanococci archaeon]
MPIWCCNYTFFPIPFFFWMFWIIFWMIIIFTAIIIVLSVIKLILKGNTKKEEKVYISEDKK